MKRNLAILGSTGSIGTQALEVVSEHPDLFEVYALTANNQVDLLINQARKYMPEVVVIANEQKYPELKEALEDLPIKVWAGSDAIAQVVQSEPIDMVLTAMVGYAGLKPTIAAIKAGKAIALANKETLVVTKVQALKHPNWSMGAKITIDSASMMNKGFEMIEAKWLFGVTPEQIQVVVHPQSVIHSMVQFEDGAVIAQLGIPDMKLPISYAFSYPKRLHSKAPRLDFTQYATLTFEEPDMERFRNLAFAFDAVRKGGNMPCILNAANEVVVAAFLRDEIGFLQMSDVIEKTMAKATFISVPTYEDYVATDAEARKIAEQFFN